MSGPGSSTAISSVAKQVSIGSRPRHHRRIGRHESAESLALTPRTVPFLVRTHSRFVARVVSFTGQGDLLPAVTLDLSSAPSGDAPLDAGCCPLDEVFTGLVARDTFECLDCRIMQLQPAIAARFQRIIRRGPAGPGQFATAMDWRAGRPARPQQKTSSSIA